MHNHEAPDAAFARETGGGVSAGGAASWAMEPVASAGEAIPVPAANRLN